MSINRISIIRSLGKVFSKTKKILGIQGENMKDVLLFALDEKIEGNAIVEIELPNGTRSFIELTEVEDGYELPVKSVLTEQVGFVKFQLRILQNKVEVFKSEIFELEVKESLNAVYEEPDEYPTWLDKLENLQSELNEAENERVSNEEERVNAEEKRKKDFEQIQESAKNIKDLTDDYNSNATEKTKEFNENYTQKLETFNDNCLKATTNFNNNAKLKYDDYNKNADDKVSNYNNNHDEKIKIYNDNHTSKITEFNNNAKAKIDDYNSNASKKLEEYNSNDKTKTEAYNTNASTKLNNYNSNVTTKENEYNSNAENKTNEFNNNASEKLEEYNQNAESLINRVVECEAENERLREDIKSIAIVGEENGESIHIEDSSDARCELEIGGNQKQDTREGYNILPYPFTDTTFQANGIKYTDLEDGSVNVNGTNTGYSGFALVKNMNFKAGTYTFYGTPNTNVDKNSFRIRLGDADNNDKLIDVVGNVPITLTFDKEMNINVILQVLAEKEITISNVVWKPMIILGADINKKYEQYGASPSFAYPSSVKAVGDVKNILNMSNAKGGTSGGITCNMIADGSYTYKGTASSKAINIWLLGSYNNKTSIFRLEPGTYYIDGVVLFDGNNVLANPDTAKIFTFINAHDITGVRVLDAVLENTYDETKYPIIAEIDHEIPWVPYDYGSVQVNMQNKNYLANIAQSSVTENGITTTYDGEKFLCKGTTTSSFFGASKKTNIYLPIDTYTFSQNAISRGRFVLRLYYRDNTFSTHYISTATWRVSFTTSKEAVSFGIFCDSLSSGINIDYTVYVQLERGATNTDWIKPEIQQRIFPVQQEMLEGDTFVRQDGKWYEKHCWKKMLLNGTEKVGVSGASTNEILAIVYDINNAVDGFGYSNYFLYSSQVELNKMSVYNGGKNLRVNVSKMQFADSEPFKAKLKELYEAGTPVIIYYKLAEPILLECTEAQSKVLDEIYSKAHTYKNITNISAESAEVNPTLNIKYLKDAETEHKKLQTQIDEIKQLLSTTETSAMLLNNMQTDLESEV